MWVSGQRGSVGRTRGKYIHVARPRLPASDGPAHRTPPPVHTRSPACTNFPPIQTTTFGANIGRCQRRCPVAHRELRMRLSEHRRGCGCTGHGIGSVRHDEWVSGQRGSVAGPQKRHPCRSPSASMPRTVLPTEPRRPYTPDHPRVRTSHRTEHHVRSTHRPMPTSRFGRIGRWTQVSHRAGVPFPIAGGSSERVAAPRCVSFSAGVWFAGPSEAGSRGRATWMYLPRVLQTRHRC